MSNVEQENKYEIVATSAFKKDRKKFLNNPKKIQKIIEVIEILQKKGVEGIPPKMQPHILIGNYAGCLECHIESDLLLIWIEKEVEKVIYLMRLGSHSDLFS